MSNIASDTYSMLKKNKNYHVHLLGFLFTTMQRIYYKSMTENNRLLAIYAK
jgi:aspartate/glutamate racemase